MPDLRVRLLFQDPHGAPNQIVTVSQVVAQHLVRMGRATFSGIPPLEAPVIAAMPIIPIVRGLKVSVICPTYNRKKYLPGAVACFLSQTYANSEMVILDDSEESSADCIPNNPRVRYIRLRGGQRITTGEKRNICCELSTGEIIVHFDDDDWQAPTRIADQVEQLEKSKKQVLSYYNILYWNEDTQQVYRCWPKIMCAPHGATFCFRKEFWEKNKFFPELGGEDTNFGFAAMKLKQMLYVDAAQQMVLRARHENVSKDARGNVSKTANSMGTHNIPIAHITEIPPGFFGKPAAPPTKTALDDLVVAVVQGLGWPALRSYANSLVRTGFSGTKLLLTANLAPDVRTNLLRLGFKLLDIEPVGQRFITHGRFAPIVQFLDQHRDEFRYIVWADTRDLVFQENPSPWLEQNLRPHRLLAASECWQIKNQPMNDKWIKETVPAEYARLREEVACCGGTLAGDADAVYEILAAIYKLVSGSPHANDQAALNYLLRVSPIKEFTRIPDMKEGFIATVGAFDTGSFKSYSAGPPLTDTAPIFDMATATVCNPETREPFVIFHQYDRDACWKAPIERKYL